MRRLQARIVKAAQEGRWGKVKALQYLLTHSFSGKALAVRRVTENRRQADTRRGRGDLGHAGQKKAAACSAAAPRATTPSRCRRVYIPKEQRQDCALGIPTMTDRAMQALYLLALDPIAETTADPNSYGFRQGRSTADAIEQCFIVLATGIRRRGSWKAI